MILNGCHFVYHRCDALSINFLCEKIKSVGYSLTFLSVYSNAMLMESFEDEVRMLRMRFSIELCYQAVIYICVYEVVYSENVTDQSLESLYGISQGG